LLLDKLPDSPSLRQKWGNQPQIRIRGQTVKKDAVKDRPKAKQPAVKLGITQLLVLGAYQRSFSTGKTGFFGKVQDPQTGKRYQIIGAVELAN
jgi:hypothetical protein